MSLDSNYMDINLTLPLFGNPSIFRVLNSMITPVKSA